jgi:hypothetical protein
MRTVADADRIAAFMRALGRAATRQPTPSTEDQGSFNRSQQDA